jgi:hypothetical protein
MSVTERGLTDDNGYYYTHFYDYEDYILVSIRKMGYILKGYSVKISQPLHVLEPVLKGSAKIEWVQSALGLDMSELQSASVQVALVNAGTATERDISISFNGTGFDIMSDYFYDELPAGQIINVSLYVFPRYIGIYGGYLTASGLRSSDSMLLSLLVRSSEELPSTTPLQEPGILDIEARRIPTPAVRIFVDVLAGVENITYELQSGFVETGDVNLTVEDCGTSCLESGIFTILFHNCS